MEGLPPEVQQRLAMAYIQSEGGGEAASAAFAAADTNKDGRLSPAEFQQWMEASVSASASATVSRVQVRQMALFTAIPMVGFGFMDNMIMIIAGDAIESTLGLTLGLTTLAAAGLGNLISDVAGLGLGGYIEASSEKLGIRKPILTRAQEASKTLVRTRALSNLLGISAGCILGMFPLLFIDVTQHRPDAAEAESWLWESSSEVGVAIAGCRRRSASCARCSTPSTSPTTARSPPPSSAAASSASA